MTLVTQRSFGADPLDVRAARSFVASESPEAVRSDVALVVSELASNAVLHAATPFDVVVRRSATTLHVDVVDGSGVMPEVRRPPPGSVTGRGLSIVDLVVDRWGVAPTPSGKRVWFEIDLARRVR